MHEADKLEEAEYFLKQMASIGEDRKANRHNLSAFLSAGRSVLQFARKEATSKPGGNAWYDTQVAANPVVIFFRDRRDVSIHEKTVSPTKELQVHIEETLYTDDTTNAVVILDGGIARSEPRQHSSRPGETNVPRPSSVTVSETYRFSEWNGAEDVPTLCVMYLAELRRIVVDGQSKGYLTP
jgi:hypothetical protein